MSRTLHTFVAFLFALSLAACGGDDAGGGNGDGGNGEEGGFPGTADGATALMTQFVQSGADTAALSATLRPTAEDYAAAFVGDAGAKVDKAYKPLWDGGQANFKPKTADQTEVRLTGATTEDLKNGSGNAGKFAGGWKKAAKHLKPGLTWYRIEFLKPGDERGMSYDGLVHVNGRWVIFPKAWRALR